MLLKLVVFDGFGIVLESTTVLGLQVNLVNSRNRP